MAYIRCNKKSGEATTDITPSNLVPATLTQNTPVKPTANGYAIASYNSVTPSNSSPVALTSGDIDKMGGNGYAIASYDDVTPSSTPVGVGSDGIVKFNSAGYIVDSVTPAPTLQTKTVTATTSQQSVTPDTGYDGLDEVIVNPQVHTATYTPSDNTAQNDMGATNNYRYVDTSGMVTPSSITPSNSTPASLTSGNAVTPTANGYAIESYGGIGPISIPTPIYNGEIIQVVANDGVVVDSITNVTPSSTPTSVSSGDNIHIGGSGVIVDSVPPTPTGITPDNTNPVALTADTPVTPTTSGYAIASYSAKTPSNTSPASVSVNSIIQSLANGYLVTSVNGLYSSKSRKSSSGSKTWTISGLTAKRKYLLLIFGISNSSGSYTNYDGATVDSGTISKITNLLSISSTVQGTFYNVTPNGTSITISHSSYFFGALIDKGGA